MEKLYRNQVVRAPELEELNDLNNEHGLHIPDTELPEYREYIKGFLEHYQTVHDLIPHVLEVKYPRTPGYRPEPEDNLCNAWYWKCNIEGAPDGKLKGKCVAIKDCICVAGVPMANGSTVMDGYVPDVDATVVTRILDAGGRITGKTNCENMCFSGSSLTSDFGPTLNPHDHSRVAGGSSSGSCAAICNGEVDLSVGSDQAGSIRIPASWCGLVGLKPTWGLVPFTGAVSIETAVDHLGPITRTVKECAVLLEVIAGCDEDNDGRQPRDLNIPKYSDMLDYKLNNKKWRIGLVEEGFEHCDSDVQTIVRDAAMRLVEAGAMVDDISIPWHKHGQAIFSPIDVEGAYQCMLQECGAGVHSKGYIVESMVSRVRAGYQLNSRNLSEPLKLLYLLGSYTQKNYGHGYYARAQNLTIKLIKAYDAALNECDVIIMPTLPYTAPLLPKKNSSVTDRLKDVLGMIRNTSPFNITGHPALTINAGLSQGLPVGLMIIGKRFEDVKVLQTAYALEQLLCSSK